MYSEKLRITPHVVIRRINSSGAPTNYWLKGFKHNTKLIQTRESVEVSLTL